MATTPGAVVAATLCWACYDGFVLHTLGTLEGGRADLVALAVVVVAALAAQLVGAVTRHAQAVGAGSGRLAPVSGRLARMDAAWRVWRGAARGGRLAGGWGVPTDLVGDRSAMRESAPSTADSWISQRSLWEAGHGKDGWPSRYEVIRKW